MNYADDTQVYVSMYIDEKNQTIGKLGSFINEIKTWCVSKTQILSDNKTELMHAFHHDFVMSTLQLPR